MRERILALVDALRHAGVRVSVSETLDAVRAVGVAGVERPVLRETLAATLVKDEADRPAFDALFDRLFPTGGPWSETTNRRRRRGGAATGGAGRGAGAEEGRGGRGRLREAEPDTPDARARLPTGRAALGRGARPRSRSEVPRDAGAREATRAAGARRLRTLPFTGYTSADLEDARALARALASRLRGRLGRRGRQARRGRLDVRRTLRAAVATGGAPAALRFRAPRPARPDLVALCDLSGSVAHASELLLTLLAPLAHHFRHVTRYVYVDRLCPVSIEDGHVAPEGPLDLHARSDLGRVLVELAADPPASLGRSTLLLVVGDARNNRRPPRADRLRALRDRVQRVVWLVPEPRARWNTGDSVLAAYAPWCDAVLEVTDLGALARAVSDVVLP